MKNPSITDRVVPVTAYLTDELFGHDYWAARQYMAPNTPSRRYAMLMICDSERERDVWVNALKVDRLPPDDALDLLRKLRNKGEVALAVSVEDNKLRVDFGQDLAWLALDKAHLDLFIAMLTEKRKELT